MKLKCLGCEALARLIYLSAAQSSHIVDVELFKLGLHNHPLQLRDVLQERIDATPVDEYDAVVLVYGICGQATIGLTARALPLVIPRAHDCITLFLGDRMRYKDQFDNFPGTYWYSVDYIERGKSGESLGATASSTDLSAEYDRYVEKFGKDNADYLMEVMGAWHSHYQRAVYLDMGSETGSNPTVEARAQEQATRRGWMYERMTGDMVLIRKLILGEWDDNFLRVEPGQGIGMSYDNNIVECVLH
jgi:hypothetical protein